jgi:hypothetical protein
MNLCCVKCGAKAKPGCDCGVAYVPAHMYAVKAVAAHPEKSDRAIAAAIGVDHKTVAKARKSVGDKSPTRIGTDGKRYRATKQMTPALAEAMKARAEAVARLFPPAFKSIPVAARAELLTALHARAWPLAETIRKRLNLKWDDLIVPAAIENENTSTLRVGPAQRPFRVASAA